MANIIKCCDFPKEVAANVFLMLNPSVTYTEDSYGNNIFITDEQPNNLIYPEGWYYEKGTFRNKHNSTTGIYEALYMFTSEGILWKNIVV